MATQRDLWMVLSLIDFTQLLVRLYKMNWKNKIMRAVRKHFQQPRRENLSLLMAVGMRIKQLSWVQFKNLWKVDTS